MEELPVKLKQAKVLYRISFAFMGEILGFGPNQLLLYEKGSAPNKSHLIAINIILTPFGMKSYLDNSPNYIKARKEFSALYSRVQKMCSEIEQECEKLKQSLNETYLQTSLTTSKEGKDI